MFAMVLFGQFGDVACDSHEPRQVCGALDAIDA